MVSMKIFMSTSVSIMLVCMLKSSNSRILLSVVSQSAIHKVNSSMNITMVTGWFVEYGGLYITIRVMFFPARLTLYLATSKLLGVSMTREVIVKLDFVISGTPQPLCVSLFMLCSTKLSLLNADVLHHALSLSLFCSHVFVTTHISVLFSLI